MNVVPPCFYRIGIKALILNERNEFLLCKEEDGTWELPGGGIEWGDNHIETLQREIYEEMGLHTTFIANTPSYFVTDQRRTGFWLANVLFKTEVEHYEFTPSEECIAIDWFTPEKVKTNKVFGNVAKFAEQFSQNS